MTITAGTRAAPHRAAPWKTDVTEVVRPAEGYARWAGTYDSGLNPLLALEQRCLLPLLPPIEKQRVLDLACGTGRWFDLLATREASRLVGVDSSMEMLSVATGKRSCGSRLVRADISCLPFPADHFDFAICSFAIGHISDVGLFARECRRVLNRKASLWISDVHPEAHKAGWRTGFRDEIGRVEIKTVIHTTEELVTAFHEAGFESSDFVQFAFGSEEKAIFSRNGRGGSFQEACRVPAILVCQFR